MRSCAIGLHTLALISLTLLYITPLTTSIKMDSTFLLHIHLQFLFAMQGAAVYDIMKQNIPATILHIIITWQRDSRSIDAAYNVVRLQAAASALHQ